MKRLNHDCLQQGDIILTTTTAAVSKTIRFATRSDISHAMLYVADCSVIDATNECVQSRNTQHYFLEDECAVHVMRLRGGLLPATMDAVCTSVRKKVGTQYSIPEAMKCVTGGSEQWSRKQFCSRLVAQAFAEAGINLVDDVNYCSPDDLKRSPLLIEVPDSTVSVTKEEVEFWERRKDVTKEMRDTTNTLLDGARKRNSRIQTIQDMIEHLKYHQDDDLCFSTLLERSGYLSVLSTEKAKNPWQYDLSLLTQTLTPDLARTYCESILRGRDEEWRRFEGNRSAMKQILQHYNLRFFQKMLKLYEDLVEAHLSRVAVAESWFTANQ